MVWHVARMILCVYVREHVCVCVCSQQSKRAQATQCQRRDTAQFIVTEDPGREEKIKLNAAEPKMVCVLLHNATHTAAVGKV